MDYTHIHLINHFYMTYHYMNINNYPNISSSPPILNYSPQQQQQQSFSPTNMPLTSIYNAQYYIPLCIPYYLYNYYISAFSNNNNINFDLIYPPYIPCL